MKYLIILICICFFTSCKIEKKISPGIYQSAYRGDKYVRDPTVLTLNADSTFSFSYKSGFLKEISSGIWTQNNNELYLNSKIIDMRDITLVISESKNNTSPFNEFIIKDINFDENLWSLVINNKYYPIKSGKAIVSKEVIINDFYIEGHIQPPYGYIVVPYPLHDTIRSRPYYPKNTANNVFVIDLPSFFNDDIFYFKILNLKLKFNKEYLILKERNRVKIKLNRKNEIL